MSRSKKDEANIAYRDGTITHEALPFPVIFYPGHYGTFFAFQRQENEEVTLCACSREAVSNYIKLKLSDISNHYQREPGEAVFDSHDFPKKFVNQFSHEGINQDLSLLDNISFQTGLCHECNEKIPKLYYCHKMYGTIFDQNFGWYVNKKYFEYGVDPSAVDIDPTICSQKILDAIGFDSKFIYSNYLQLKNKSPSTAKELWLKINEMFFKLRELIHNEVRLKFGHKRLGESWTTETMLFYIVKSIYPEYHIRRHYRPNFLEGLELDIYIEEINTGIEYQGIQHFQPVEHWGGQAAFAKLIERDKRKKALCQSLSIRLIFFDYNENLNNDLVSERLGLI